jgi:hypothetical protein
MKYHLIKGKFHVKGYSPDGDSIRFQAANDANWAPFQWSQASNRTSPKKQLRFEAIDALETHYQESHQPRAFGFGALEVLLKLLGIGGVKYNLSLTLITDADDGTDGFIATQGLDMYDRPISLVFFGTTALKDGSQVTLSKLPMEQCANLRMARAGLAYPTFYSSMEPGLLKIFTDVTAACRKGQVGLWALDKTGGFTLRNTSTLTDDVVILPKLFRRLTSFCLECSSFEELPAYMHSTQDRVLIRQPGVKATLDQLLTISPDGRSIALTQPPENLIFDPKG